MASIQVVVLLHFREAAPPQGDPIKSQEGAFSRGRGFRDQFSTLEQRLRPE